MEDARYGYKYPMRNTLLLHEEKLTYFGYTRKQLKTMIIFCLANLFSSNIYALQAPFYPKEAEAKGATATEYGFVLGVFQFVMFIMSAVYGSIIGYVNPRIVFNMGITITATCAGLFGFLDYIDDRVTFIALSFVLRVLQACGDSAFVTASYTIIAMEFPETVATTFAAFETFFGLGLMLGPGLGGALYELGGFPLPFLFMAGCLYSVSLLTFLYLPEVSKPVAALKDNPNSNGGRHKSGLISILSIPEVALAFFSIVISASSIGFLVACLEPHLRENFGVTPAVTGLIFMIDGGMYAISAPIWGRLCDKSSQPKIFTFAGAIMTFTGFLLIGPAPFIPLPTIMWLTCIGLVIHGLGTASSCVSAFLQALQGAVKGGFPDSVATYGLISGLWMSSFAFGNFVGPSVGGILLDNFGFRLGTLFVLGAQVLIVILTSLFFCSSKKNSASESKTLLDSKKDPRDDFPIDDDIPTSTWPNPKKAGQDGNSFKSQNEAKTSNSKALDYGAT